MLRRRRPLLLLALGVGAALSLGASAAAVPTQSLDGEYINIPGFHPQVIRTTTCTDHPDGTQSFEYTIVPEPAANPTVFHAQGPYPGPFSFTFTGTLGQPGPFFGPEAGDYWRPLLDLSAVFTIESGSTDVTGSVFLDPSAPSVFDGANWAYGFCNGPTNWSGQVLSSHLLWQATIDDGAGTLDDQGTATPFEIGYTNSPLRISFTSTSASQDADGDGVPDDIDSDGGAGSGPPGFLDETGGGVPTAGTVTLGSVTVVDVADPQGVRITAGAAGASLSVCGQFGLALPSGGSLTLTCGSVTVGDVSGGPVAVTVPSGAIVTFPDGASGTVDIGTNGAVIVSDVAGSGVTLTVDGVSVDLGSGGSWNVIQGTHGNDRLRGTAENDLILGYGGNDRIDGGGGADVIDAGAGNNEVKADAGDDVVVAGAGNDAIDGGSGSDACTPGGGRDAVRNCETIVR